MIIDFSGSKLRPVLVLSSTEFNQNARDIIVSKITGTAYDSNYEILMTQDALDQGILKKPSYIDLGFIMTVEKVLIKKKIGMITMTL